ncbi:DUF4184 family protein [Micromonospora phytophila]|uniref:DUF4184 family protein n=1 Tax=Micromonospora phytophila TaxID=709888 RepID=UPI00202FCD4B|nr:DUF4184 family protein [Micromonospora phytophila]MCM0673862.1 DUF4184 family protein [Micromonospora phytophila]
MPLTFPSHPGVVLPLKLWRPRWFDGVALTTGAVAPDVRYALLGVGPEWQSHTLTALVWWCVPVALLGAWLVRATVATLAAHLPHLGPFALRDYGVLATVRHPWQITAGSALLGAATHIGWDHLTHTAAWLRIVFGIDWDSVSEVAWWTVSDIPSSLVGALVTLGVAVVIGRRRLLRAWHGNPPPVRTRSMVFWPVAGAVATIGYALTPVLPAAGLPWATVVRLLCVTAGALLVAAVAVQAVNAKITFPAETPTLARGSRSEVPPSSPNASPPR